MTNLIQALLNVMKEIPGIEKNMTVGSGSYAYQGVSDKDVKTVVRNAMINHGLVIVPVDIQDSIQIDRWEEQREFKGTVTTSQKQSVFTTVKVTYKLLHKSGESLDIVGYGHGVDSQDKGAGKATTYALKYALLYLGLIPTGAIDDADKEHSDDHPVPKKQLKDPIKVMSNSEGINLLKKAKTVQELNTEFRKLPDYLQSDKEIIDEASKIKSQLKPKK